MLAFWQTFWETDGRNKNKTRASLQKKMVEHLYITLYGWLNCCCSFMVWIKTSWWFHILCLPLFGEDSHFDYFFKMGWNLQLGTPMFSWARVTEEYTCWSTFKGRIRTSWGFIRKNGHWFMYTVWSCCTTTSLKLVVFRISFQQQVYLF